MKAVFSDTYFYLALLNQRDSAHRQVIYRSPLSKHGTRAPNHLNTRH